MQPILRLCRREPACEYGCPAIQTNRQRSAGKRDRDLSVVRQIAGLIEPDEDLEADADAAVASDIDINIDTIKFLKLGAAAVIA